MTKIYELQLSLQNTKSISKATGGRKGVGLNPTRP